MRLLSKNGAPSLHVADHLVLVHNNVRSSKDGKTWVLARPLGWQGLVLMKRLRLAWGVFTGRFDALEWVEQK